MQSDSYLIVAGRGIGHVDWLADADVTVTSHQVYRTTGSGTLFYLEGYVDGRLTVRFIESPIEISVVDTGVGLTPEFLPFAFDRFRQADQSLTRPQGGLASAWPS